MLDVARARHGTAQRLLRPGGHRQVVLLLIANLTGAAASALMYALIARQVGVVSLGGALSVLGVIVFAVALMDFGSNNLVVRELNTGGMTSPEARGRAYAKAMVTGVTVGGLAIVATSATSLPTVDVALGVVCAVLLQHEQSLQAHLRGVGAVVASSSSMVVDRLTGLCVTLGMTLLDQASTLVLWYALIAGTLSGALFCEVALRVRGSVIAPLRNPYRRGSRFGTAAVAAAVQPLDVPVVHTVAGAAAAGTYGAVSRWTAPLALVPAAISHAVMTRMCVATSHRDALVALLSTWRILGLTWIAAGAVAWFGPALVALVLTGQYRDSAGVLRILMIATVPMSLSQLLQAYLQARRAEGLAARAVATVVVLEFALLPVVAATSSATGAALVILATHSTIATWMSMSVATLLRAERKKTAQ